jgi:hypothetical protein
MRMPAPAPRSPSQLGDLATNIALFSCKQQRATSKAERKKSGKRRQLVLLDLTYRQQRVPKKQGNKATRQETPELQLGAKAKASESKRRQAKASEGKRRQAKVSEGKRGQAKASERKRRQAKASESKRRQAKASEGKRDPAFESST